MSLLVYVQDLSRYSIKSGIDGAKLPAEGMYA